jgi:hypothetical protein
MSRFDRIEQKEIEMIAKRSASGIGTVEAASLIGRSPGSNGAAEEIKLSGAFVWGTTGSKPQLNIAVPSDATKVDTATQINSGLGLTGGGDLSTNRTIAVDFAASGVSSATKAVRADDSRLSDARTPLSHTHPISAITDVQLTSVSDNDVIQFSTSTSKWTNRPQTDLVDGGNF